MRRGDIFSTKAERSKFAAAAKASLFLFFLPLPRFNLIAAEGGEAEGQF